MFVVVGATGHTGSVVVETLLNKKQPVLAAAKAQGVLPSIIASERKIPMISTRDIGRISAEQLMAGGQGRKVLELTGPEDYSPNDVAAALAQLLGRTVTVQHAPLSAVVPTFKSFGFSDEAATLFGEMYTALSKGAIRYEHPEKLLRGAVTLSQALSKLIA